MVGDLLLRLWRTVGSGDKWIEVESRLLLDLSLSQGVGGGVRETGKSTIRRDTRE